MKTNQLIKGDNLPILNKLKNKLASKIKLIYIDPPYNNKSTNFEYQNNQTSKSWLNLIEPRLKAGYDLLSEDGSIWISIDDNECHYLKILCDSLFNRNNFITSITRQTKYTRANDARHFSPNHDYILIYAKKKPLWNINRLPRTEKANKRYSNPDHDPRGKWKSTPLHAKSGKNKEPYTFTNGVTWAPPTGTFRRYINKTMEKLEKENKISFGSTTPRRKTFLNDVSNMVPTTIWTRTEVGDNHEAKDEVKETYPGAFFSTPKPKRLLEKIIHIASNPNDLILDFFAGSGTTGITAEEMNRSWIMIEEKESTISLCKSRLEKATSNYTYLDWSKK